MNLQQIVFNQSTLRDSIVETATEMYHPPNRKMIEVQSTRQERYKLHTWLLNALLVTKYSGFG